MRRTGHRSPGDSDVRASNSLAWPLSFGKHQVVSGLEVRRLTAADPESIVAAFAALGWSGKTGGLYRRYLHEQTRVVFARLTGDACAPG